MNIKELLLPLARGAEESYEDYRKRRTHANALIKFYLRRHHWPKEQVADPT